MDNAHIIETTPLIAQHDNNLPDHDDEKESTVAKNPDEDEPVKDTTHLNIWLTALTKGIIGCVLFMLLYPLFYRLISFLLSLVLSSKAMGVGDNEYALHPLTFGFMMFFGHLGPAYMERYWICKECQRFPWCKCRVGSDQEEAGGKSEQ